MLNTISKLITFMDLICKRYITYQASSEQDYLDCKQLLNEVFAGELNRSSHAVINDDDTIILCRNKKTNELLGCATGCLPAALLGTTSYENYKVDAIPDDLQQYVTVGTGFAIKKQYRKTITSYLLIEASFKNACQNNHYICLSTCQPALYPLYKRMGFRAFGRIYKSMYGGYQLPIILLTQDKVYLKKIKSPLLKHIKSEDTTENQKVLDWYYNVFSKNDLNTGVEQIQHLDTKFYHTALTNGMSKKGIESLMKHAILIHAKRDEILVNSGDGGENIFLIKHGIVDVFIQEKYVNSMSEGEFFGEISFILDTNRTAKLIVASEQAKVVVLSKNMLARLNQKDDVIIFWKNLAQCLASRLVNTTKIMN